MNKQFRFAVVTLALVLGACAPAQSGVGTPGAAGAEPEEVVETFYNWYLGQAAQGNPLVDRAYGTLSYLDPALVEQLDEVAGSGMRVADPVLCAQDVPGNVTVSPVTMDGDEATVSVATDLGNTLNVQLRSVNGQWLISDITCQ